MEITDNNYVMEYMFMAPRSKMIVILNFLWNEFVETMSDVSICLEHRC